MLYWMYALCMVLILGFCPTVTAKAAAQENQQVDIQGLSQEINEVFQEEEAFDSSVLYGYISSLQFKKAFLYLGNALLQILTREFTNSWSYVLQIMGILLFSILFTNVLDTMKNYPVAENIFLISYFLIFLLIIHNFKLIHALYDQSIVTLSDLLKVMIPVYSLSISLTGNITTAALSYEYFMVLVLIINYLAVHFISPLVHYYLILELINHFSEGKRISKLCDALHGMLSKGINLLFFLFFGFHLLELMIVPAFDLSRHSLIQKLIGTIPGMGSAVQTVTGTVLGSAVFIKNTLGVTIMLVLCAAMLLPIIKIGLYTLLYLILSIVLEPVCDKRFIGCISAVEKSGRLYMKAVSLCMVLFLLSVALCAVTTNQL